MKTSNQNILIYGSNILLTDFGFSLDFADNSISTTTGRPSAWTVRYAAPEVLKFEARNRATDIYSLGCILIEMLSRIYEYRLSDLKDFWKRNDNTHISFSVNEEATLAWYNHLGTRMKNRGPKLIIFLDETEPSAQELPFLCFVRHMIEHNRALRPTAQQVVDRIMDLRLLFPTSSTMINDCCQKKTLNGNMQALRDEARRCPRLAGYFQLAFSANHSFVVIDRDQEIIASKSSLGGFKESSSDIVFDDALRGMIAYACKNLLQEASRCGTTRDIWSAHQPRTVRSYTSGLEHFRSSITFASLKHTVYTRFMWPVDLL